MKKLLPLLFLLMSGLSYAVVYSTQPANGTDTSLIYDAPTNNYGSTIYMRVRKASDTVDTWRISTGLVKFDLTPLTSQTIQGATLYLYLDGASWVTRGRFVCNRILSVNSDWVAGTNDGVPLAGASCWSYKIASTTLWASSGCATSNLDWSNVTMGTYDLGNQNLADGYQMVLPLSVSEMTTMVSANYGFLLHITGTDGSVGGISTDFYSSENATAAYRPKLEVEYAASAVTGSRRKLSQVIQIW